MDGGHTFNWLCTHDGEIFGHVEDPEGLVIYKSDGFYRTKDPQLAVRFAEAHVPSEEKEGDSEA